MLDAMARAELEKELKKAADELEEIDEMRSAVLGQTGVHIGAKELQRHYDQFDGSQKRLTARIHEIRAQLANAESQKVVVSGE